MLHWQQHISNLRLLVLSHSTFRSQRHLGILYYDQATDSFVWQEIAEADTYKFKVNDTDPLPGYMADKIADTSDVSLSINAVTRKLEAKLLVDIPAPDDHMLLASSADQTPGYLVSKIADTESIKLDINKR